MKILIERHGLTLRRTLLTAVAMGAVPLSAFARDLPPTPEGAQKLSAIFATYLAKPAAGAPSPVTVTVEGAHYAVALDVANLAAPLMAAGFSIDPAVATCALTEQDDGTWHVTSDSLPPISAHFKDGAIAYNFTGYKFDGIYDPALLAFKSAKQSLDKTAAQVHEPKVDETITIGAINVMQTAAPAANGAVSLVAHEEIADISANISVKPGDAKAAAGAKPVPVSFQLATTLADITLDGTPVRKVLDLWAFVAAHSSRPEIAANEPEFKTLLRALAPAELKLAEKAEMKQIAVGTPQGDFGLANARFGIAASSAPGSRGSAEYDLAMDGLTMPAGLLPPAMSDLAPTAFNIAVKASGFDAGAGVEEAINDMHFAGEGPVISEADSAQIFAKMKGTGPVVIELLPSHIVAPQIDLTIEGQVHLEGARPSGIMKVHVRNFDRTVAALKAIGPLASPQLLGGLALAKTLGKSEGDGALIWVAEYGPDGSIKVNGLPLGKAP